MRALPFLLSGLAACGHGYGSNDVPATADAGLPDSTAPAADAASPTEAIETILTEDAGVALRSVNVVGTRIYWANQTERTVGAADVDGTNRVDIVDASDQLPDLLEIYVAGDTVWQSGSAGLWRKSISSARSVPNKLALGGGMSGCASLDSDGVTLWAASYQQNAIFAVSATMPEGGASTTHTGLAEVWGVVATSEALYFTVGTSQIAKRSPKAPASTSVPVIGNQANPNCLTIDGDDLYWATYDDGTIHRSKLDGTGEVAIATHQNRPTRVAVDARFLYWNSGNTIVRKAR